MSVSGTPVGRYRVVVSTCMLIRRCRLGHTGRSRVVVSTCMLGRRLHRSAAHRARAIKGDRTSHGRSREIAARTGNQGRSHLARARRRWPLDECRRVRRPPSLTEPQAPRARGTAASDLMRHAIRGHQWPSVVIRPDEARHRGSSVVIRPDEARHRRSSVVIRPDEARHRRSSGALWFTHVYTQVHSGDLRWPQVHSGAIRCNQTVGLVDRVQI